MRTNEVNNSADVLDSRDVIKRLEELEDERESYQEENLLPDIDLPIKPQSIALLAELELCND